MSTKKAGVSSVKHTSKDCIFNFMKNLVAVLFFPFVCQYLHAADSLTINSPDKKIEVIVHYTGRLRYSINYLHKPILLSSFIDMELQNGKRLSDGLQVSK